MVRVHVIFVCNNSCDDNNIQHQKSHAISSLCLTGSMYLEKKKEKYTPVYHLLSNQLLIKYVLPYSYKQ